MIVPEPQYLTVGRVLRPHGVRGEVRVEILTGYPERLSQHSHFLLAPPIAPEDITRYPVERVRPHGELALVKLGGCDDRNAAELLRGMLVQIPVENAVPLEEGEHYHFQVIGLEVETDTGEYLGEVVDVLETRANDVYIVRGPAGELLVPAIDDVVLDLDPEARRMVIHVLPGMMD
jgi:16S rRNA processing protein RimM